MNEIELLTSLAMFLLVAAVCSIVFNKIKLPPLIGYLIAGIVIANTIDVSESAETVVEMLSNMGLILLMFCIGLEINLKKLRKQGMFAMKVAAVEIPFMVLGGTVVGSLLGLDSIQSICLGGVIAGSSTAVVLGVLNMQNRLPRDQIETLILVIIMEDISQVIILSMLTPLMAGSELDAGGLAAMVFSIMFFMIVSIFAGLKLMPRIINWVSDNVSPEILTITAVGLAFGMALLASFAGLSVAIGAFLMGMMIASSRKSKDILHEIEPMKSIFMAMFFISVGMEIALGTLMDNLILTLVFLVMFIVLKTMAVFFGYWIGGEEPRSSIAQAVSFLAMGEFAFIIAKQAFDYNVFSEGIYTAIVGSALLSMICLPFVSKNAVPLWDWAARTCPDPIVGVLKKMNATKRTFYENIASTSKKTRKEISSSMTISYMLLLVVAFVEIIFILVTPIIREWGTTYFGGSDTMWSFLILLVNLFALYIPIYRLVSNLKIISTISKKADSLKKTDYGSRLIKSVVLADASILSLIFAVLILFIIPNDLGLMEHFLVLGVGLIILIAYNARSVRQKEEEVVNDFSDEPYDVTLDEFKTILSQKVEERMKSNDSGTTVSINTKDLGNKE
jgi:CPA2 family monovalent cation:H+ antiporter-2